MENSDKFQKIAENALFALLGAVCAAVLSLATFGAVDNRSPASLEEPARTSDFDPRVYLPFLY